MIPTLTCCKRQVQGDSERLQVARGQGTAGTGFPDPRTRASFGVTSCFGSESSSCTTVNAANATEPHSLEQVILRQVEFPSGKTQQGLAHRRCFRNSC